MKVSKKVGEITGVTTYTLECNMGDIILILWALAVVIML